MAAVAMVIALLAMLVAIAIKQPNPSQFLGGVTMRQGGLVVLVGVPTVAAVLIIMHAVRRERKQRLIAAEAEYARLGFSCVMAPGKNEREALFQNAAHLSMLRTGSKGLLHVANGVLDETPIEVVEHQYIVSTGKSAHVVRHIVASCECPAGWPVLSLTPEHLLHKIGEVLGIHDIRVESESFNRAWRVKSEDEAFAVTLLSPALQTWMENNSKHESWYIGHGRVCRVRKQSLKPELFEPFMRGLLELVSLIPPEMWAWESAKAKA